MRYLPDFEWGSQDRYWKALPGEIRRQLQLTDTMWTRSHLNMRCIADVRLLPSSMCDKYGKPLLPDLDTEQYLSPHYALKDLNSLRDYGLQLMNRHEFVDRLQQDIKSDSSLMRNPNTNEDWHSAVAKYLMGVLGPKNPKTAEKIKKIKLIPLMGGHWRSSSALDRFPVYFTRAQGHAIPTDGIFDLIAPSAEINPDRKQLFVLLGVQEASVRDIRREIIHRGASWAHGLETSQVLFAVSLSYCSSGSRARPAKYLFSIKAHGQRL